MENIACIFVVLVDGEEVFRGTRKEIIVWLREWLNDPPCGVWIDRAA